jgi:hypothetical protein
VAGTWNLPSSTAEVTNEWSHVATSSYTFIFSRLWLYFFYSLFPFSVTFRIFRILLHSLKIPSYRCLVGCNCLLYEVWYERADTWIAEITVRLYCINVKYCLIYYHQMKTYFIGGDCGWYVKSTKAHVRNVRQLQSLKLARGGLAQPFSHFLSIHRVTPAPIFASLRFTGHIGASFIWNTLYAKSLIKLSFQGDKVASELVDVGRKEWHNAWNFVRRGRCFKG